VATPREQLASLLRQARVNAGYASHGALARKLNVSRPLITRAENPRQVMPSDAVLKSWARVTGIDPDEVTRLAQRVRSGDGFARWAEDIEARATMIREFAPLLIPGLLQTESYARAVVTWKPESARADVNLRNRLERQSVLDRAELRVVLLGSVLNREVGDASVMVEQIERLLSVGERPNVVIQVMPDTPAVAGALGGAFTIATEGAADVAVLTDSLVKDGIYTDAALVARAVRLFDGIRADALPWAQTKDNLAEAGRRWTI